MNKHLPVLITLLTFGSFGVVGDELPKSLYCEFGAYHAEFNFEDREKSWFKVYGTKHKYLLEKTFIKKLVVSDQQIYFERVIKKFNGGVFKFRIDRFSGRIHAGTLGSGTCSTTPVKRDKKKF